MNTATRRRAAAAIAGTALTALLAAGCGDGDRGGPDGPSGSPTAATDSPSGDAGGDAGGAGDGDGQDGTGGTGAPGELAAAWQPRLDALPTTDATTACQQPSSTACPDLLTEIANELARLDEALEAAGPQAYPKTTREVSAAMKARGAYVGGGCSTGGGPMSQADCLAEALAVSTGPAKVGLMLSAEDPASG